MSDCVPKTCASCKVLRREWSSTTRLLASIVKQLDDAHIKITQLRQVLVLAQNEFKRLGIENHKVNGHEEDIEDWYKCHRFMCRTASEAFDAIELLLDKED